MKVIDKNTLVRNMVIHPYDSNKDYFAKVNMFYYSEDGKFAAAYWEAPEGWFNAEVKGFNELDFVLEGEMKLISSDGKKSIFAKTGDCIILEDGDKFSWILNKFSRVVFFIYPMNSELNEFFDNLHL